QLGHVEEQAAGDGPGQSCVGLPGSCGLIMVKRTSVTPSPVPAAGVTAFSRCRSATPKLPLAATVKVVPSFEVSMRKSLVEALPPSPQVLPGSTANWETFTAAGSFTVTNFGTAVPLASKSVVEPQPLPSDWSIARSGPQPKSLKSGPLKATTLP